MTAWQLVAVGAGAAVALAAVLGAGLAGLARALDVCQDWRLDHRSDNDGI